MTALEIARIWAETFWQHNLLSTATVEERNAFIKRNIDAFNRIYGSILEDEELCDGLCPNCGGECEPNQPCAKCNEAFV